MTKKEDTAQKDTTQKDTSLQKDASSKKVKPPKEKKSPKEDKPLKENKPLKEKVKTYKCFLCKKSFCETELEYVGNKRFCLECAQKKKEEMQEKETQKSLDAKEYKELVGYVYNLYGYKSNDGLMGMIGRQIKMFMEENPGVTYRGMRLTIAYYHEILGQPVVPEKGIYRPLCKYYEAQRYQLQKYNNNVNVYNNPYIIKEMLSVETVVVDLQAKEKYNEMLEEKWKSSFYNLEEIVPDEDDDIAVDRNQELLDLLNSEYSEDFSFVSSKKKVSLEDEERKKMEELV